jgi:glycerol-3-phosphate dehydrogenase (NAD(P)+)
MTSEPPTTAPQRIAVIGAGSWGTALAQVAARNRHAVRLWAREPEVALGINTAHRNPYYLTDVELPENLRATTSLEEALDGASFVLIVTPSHTVREVVERMRPFLGAQQTIISATKGVENITLMRMDEVIADLLKERFTPRFVALSGPRPDGHRRGEPRAAIEPVRAAALERQCLSRLHQR